MAKEINVNVEDVVTSGSGLAFIAYPAAVARMPLPPLWSILFFAMLITLGLDSQVSVSLDSMNADFKYKINFLLQFTFVETLSTGIFDKFENLRDRKPLVMITLSVVMFILGLPLCLEGGVFMFELLNYYSAGLSVLFIAICEVVCVAWVYGESNFNKSFETILILFLIGFKRFMGNITQEMGIHVPTPLYWYWRITWCFVTPLFLLVSFSF